MAKKIDYILVRMIILIVVFIWVRYYAEKLTDTVIYTVLIFLGVCAFLGIFSGKKNSLKELDRRQRKESEAAVAEFLYMDEAGALEQFREKLSGFGAEIRDGCLYLPEKDLHIFLRISFDKFDFKALRDIYNGARGKQKNVLVLCDTAASGIFVAAGGFADVDITVYSGDRLRALIAKYEIYPETTVKKKIAKRKKLNEFMSAALCRRRARGYFLASITFVIASFVMRYSLYYIVFSTVLLALSFVCMLNLDFTKSGPKDVL